MSNCMSFFDLFEPPQKILFRCSTRVDKYNHHVKHVGAWGYCDMNNEACNGGEPGML